jgi:hypothetical protein
MLAFTYKTLKKWVGNKYETCEIDYKYEIKSYKIKSYEIYAAKQIYNVNYFQTTNL